jgi:hypothetical protein
MVRKTIPHKAQLALLNILFNRIIRLVLTNLLLCVRPAGDLHHHVEYLRGRIGQGRQQGNIVPGGNHHTGLLEVNPVCEGVRLTDIAGGNACHCTKGSDEGIADRDYEAGNLYCDNENNDDGR